MEDRSVVSSQLDLYAVVDGHGGAHCAEFVASHLAEMFQTLTMDDGRRGVPATTLRRTFRRLDEDFLTKHPWRMCSGCCCVSAVVVRRTGWLFVANVGDCRGLLISVGDDGRWSGRALSSDHVCTNRAECRRVRRRTTDPVPGWARLMGGVCHSSPPSLHDQPVPSDDSSTP